MHSYLQNDALDCSEEGIISGTPLSPFNGSFIVQVNDSSGLSTAKRFDLWVESPSLTAYETWKVEKFPDPTDQSDPAISGELADPDNDVIPNLLECALALEPKTAETTELPTAKAEGGYLTFTYRQNKDATDFTFTVQAASDMNETSWSANGLTETAREDMGDYWLVTVRDNSPISSSTHRFMRLKVTTP